jgi:hypothetical protein
MHQNQRNHNRLLIYTLFFNNLLTNIREQPICEFFPTMPSMYNLIKFYRLNSLYDITVYDILIKLTSGLFHWCFLLSNLMLEFLKMRYE